MTEQEVVHIIEGRREEFDLSPEMEFESAERAIVPYKPNPDEPGPVEDRIAWVVVYSYKWGMVEIHVDDRSGDILVIRRTA